MSSNSKVSAPHSSSSLSASPTSDLPSTSLVSPTTIPACSKPQMSQASQTPAQMPFGVGTSRSHRSSSSASTSQKPESASLISSTSSSVATSPYLSAQPHPPHPAFSGASSMRRHSHHRQNSSSSVKSIKSWVPGESDFPATPIRFPTAPTTGEIIDSFEREQEAIVNKLQKEIAQLKSSRSRSRSQSTSSTSSISRRPSTRSNYSLSDTEDHSTATRSTTLQPTTSSSSISAVTAAGGGTSSSQRSSRNSFGSINSLSDENAFAMQSLRKENEALKKRLAELSLKLVEKDKEIESLKAPEK